MGSLPDDYNPSRESFDYRAGEVETLTLAVNTIRIELVRCTPREKAGLNTAERLLTKLLQKKIASWSAILDKGQA